MKPGNYHLKRLSVILLMCFTTTAAIAQKQFVVDENAQRRAVDKSYNAIKVSGGIDIYLSQGNEESLAVSASEERLIKNIKTIVEGNTLKIFYEGDKSWGKNRKMVVYISFIHLEKLEASGASDVTVAGSIKVPSLEIQLSGASDFKGDVSVMSLDMHLSGASDVSISGNATTLNIDNSGASDVKGFDLTTEICTVKASGASDINITVSKELNASASGASNVFYQGSGMIKDVKSSGASTISRKG